MPARRNDADPPTGVPQSLHEGHGRAKAAHAAVAQALAEELILSSRHAMHGQRPRWVVGLPIRDVDPPSGEERPHTVETGLAVHVVPVVEVRVEGRGVRCDRGEHAIEKRGPRGGVDASCIGDHAIEVEDGSVDVVKGDRDARHSPIVAAVVATGVGTFGTVRTGLGAVTLGS